MSIDAGDHAGHDHGDHTWSPPSELESRTLALESLLIEKGRATPQAIDTIVDRYENEVGPMLGAGVVARAWSDPGFRDRLLADATSTLDELGLTGFEAERVVALECTPQQHHLVVCTLCSCYPWALLGLPPRWYKSAEYRARAVSEPRAVLREFGLNLEPDVHLTVWDSSADVRYIVVPLRPAGSDAWSERDLIRLATRESMIGVGRPLEPGQVTA